MCSFRWYYHKRQGGLREVAYLSPGNSLDNFFALISSIVFSGFCIVYHLWPQSKQTLRLICLKSLFTTMLTTFWIVKISQLGQRTQEIRFIYSICRLYCYHCAGFFWTRFFIIAVIFSGLQTYHLRIVSKR